MGDTQPAVGNDNEAADVVVRGSAAGFAQEIFAGLTVYRLMNRRRLAARTRGHLPMIYCWRPSAPAPL